MLEAEAYAEGREALSLVRDLDLCRDREVADVLRVVGLRTEVERNDGRPELAVDRQELLQRAVDLHLDVRRDADVDTDVADSRDVAVQARERKVLVLLKGDARGDTHGAGPEDLDVLGEQRTRLALELVAFVLLVLCHRGGDETERRDHYQSAEDRSHVHRARIVRQSNFTVQKPDD